MNTPTLDSLKKQVAEFYVQHDVLELRKDFEVWQERCLAHVLGGFMPSSSEAFKSPPPSHERKRTHEQAPKVDIQLALFRDNDQLKQLILAFSELMTLAAVEDDSPSDAMKHARMAVHFFLIDPSSEGEAWPWFTELQKLDEERDPTATLPMLQVMHDLVAFWLINVEGGTMMGLWDFAGFDDEPE